MQGYRTSFDATEARWRGGLASLVELEDARRTLLAAQTTLVACSTSASRPGWRCTAQPGRL